MCDTAPAAAKSKCPAAADATATYAPAAVVAASTNAAESSASAVCHRYGYATTDTVTNATACNHEDAFWRWPAIIPACLQ